MAKHMNMVGGPLWRGPGIFGPPLNPVLLTFLLKEPPSKSFTWALDFLDPSLFGSEAIKTDQCLNQCFPYPTKSYPKT